MKPLFNSLGQRICDSDSNCLIIAHRGYHINHPQNSIQSFIAAANNGFGAIEIDLQKSSDGIYILSHDSNVTLYNNGSSMSVNLNSSNYASYKNYTWDDKGFYKIATFESALNSIKKYNILIICDLKSGNNSDLIEIAARTGNLQHIMLSYYSTSQCISDVSMLQKYSFIPIRIITNNYTDLSNIKTAIANPIFADINCENSSHRKLYLPIALSQNIPIIFSGCSSNNKNIWQVICGGCMSNESSIFSHDTFLKMLDNDYTVTADISTSSSISVAQNNSSTITASTQNDSPSNYIYAYSQNPEIATIGQNSFGKSISVEVEGVLRGSTNLVLFTGSGSTKIVPITVT